MGGEIVPSKQFPKIGDAISSPKLLAVEGPDDCNFFRKLLKTLDITDVDIRSVGGKDKFDHPTLGIPALIKVSSFRDVKTFAIIGDEDEDGDKAFEKVRRILEKAALPFPAKKNAFSANQVERGKPHVGVFIVSKNLEDVCLQNVAHPEVLKCVDEFVDCLTDKPKPKNLSKARAQVYLAAMPEIVRGVGLGAKKGYWNLDSPNFDSLKTFLSAFN